MSVPIKVWWDGADEIVPLPIDPAFDASRYMVPKWWHKFIFWKKYDYSWFIFEREYLNLKELMERYK